MKLLYKQLTTKQWFVWVFSLLLTVVYIGLSNFSIVLLSYFVNLLSIAVNGSSDSNTTTTVWDHVLGNILPTIKNGKTDVMQQVYVLFALSVGLSIAGALMKMGTRIYLITLTMQMLFNLRNKLYHKIIYLDETAISKISPSSIISRLTSDMYQLQETGIDYFTYFYEAIFYVLFNIIFSITLSPLLSTTYLFLFPMALLIVWITQIRADKHYDQNLKDLDNANQIVRENLIGIRLVKSFNIQRHQYQRFYNVNQSWKRTIFKSEWIVMIGLIAMFLILNLATVVILIFGVSIIKNRLFGGISEGVIVAFLNYVIGTVFNIYGIGSLIISLIKTKPISRRFKQVLTSVTEDLDQGWIPQNFQPSIKFENVSFKYDQTNQLNVLENINLEIKQGQTVGVIGLTGSGKSSLVSLITRLYEPTSGKIYINRTAIEQINLRFLRSKIGFAPQEKLIFAGTIKSNIQNGNHDATDDEIIEAAKIACAHNFIISLPEQYNAKVTQYGSNLSGGQKQRLSLARSLIRKPQILILDDTLSALDNLTRNAILTNLKSVYQNITTIIVAQQIKTIRDADHIVVMDQGKIVAQGNHQELMQFCELYQTIHASQRTVGEP